VKQEERQINNFATRFNKYLEYQKKHKPSKASSGQFEQELKSVKENKTQDNPSPSTEKKEFVFSEQVESKDISLSSAKRLAKYASLIQDAAKRHSVPVELICGVILQESHAKSNAVSPVGAKGLMQLMPATAHRFGVKNILDPAQNIEGGTKYLSWLLKRFKGDVKLAVAGYNAGEGAVEKYGNKIPPYRETQQYVPKVLGYTQAMVEIISQDIASKDEASQLPTHARRV